MRSSCATIASWPSAVEEVDGRGEADRLTHRLRAGLEALRRGQELGLLHRHRRDGRSAGARGRQLVEQLAAAPQCADAGRPEHLVRRERREVDAELRDVDALMRHRLAGIEHRQRAARRRDRGDVRDGRDARR